MYRFALLLLPAVLSGLSGCGASWSLQDEDGDGKTLLDGDCNDAPEGGAGIGPGVAETWYDGIDQDCDGGSDFDKDGDGFDGVEGGGPDCWDDPDVLPADFEALNGFPALTAASVHPDAEDAFYDGVNANCDDASDFDADGDGFDTANTAYRQRDGSVGEDCFDASDLDDYPQSGALTMEYLPEEVNPDASDAWYDGTDQNCDGASDYDQDGDSYDRDAECDDTNAAIYPDLSIEEDWSNDIDENCDGNTHDKDLDGFVDAAWGGDDCWDDYDAIPAGYNALNGYRQVLSSEVYPGATDRPYDGTDADCAGDSDFDNDDDGVATDELPARDGSLGTDCDDDDSSVYPSAPDTWYDGTDSNCDGDSDYDADRDGYDSTDAISTGTDCDDTNAAVNPAPSTNEDCATTDDDNCDGSLDLQNADGCTVYYYDGDGDGFGTTASQCWCASKPSTNYDVRVSTDCDDASASDYPGASETVANGDDEDCDGVDACYQDADGDDYGTTAGTIVDGSSLDCVTGTGSAVKTDCNDASTSIYLGAPETVADGIDQDCDTVDTCYTDADGDNYGTSVKVDGSTLSCVTGTGAAVSTDCDDGDADTFPGAASNESATSCMNDDDGDNYGDATVSSGVTAGTDCNDASTSIYWGAAETVADGIDQDCDSVDTCYTDADGDNYGTSVKVDGSSLSCVTGTGAAVSTDCDDGDADTFPGAASNESATSCMNDDDGDNYGDATVSSGVTAGTDCNDASTSIYWGAAETVADGIDQDCDSVDTCYTDADGDNYGTSVKVVGSSLSCASGTGAAVATDCDDGDADTFPGAASNESSTACMNDDDGDNYGDKTVASGVTAGTDCNDASTSIYWGAAETVADGIDQDCDSVDTCYTDADGDNYGTSVKVVGSSLSCASGTGAAVATDCDDADADTFPGAASNESSTACMNDDDGDDYGDATVSSGVTAGTDCNDEASAVNPAPSTNEDCNTTDDDNCDGSLDLQDADNCTLFYYDGDGDGFGSATSQCWCESQPVTNYDAPVSTDCLDSDGYTFPGAASSDSETECMTDADGDGFGDDVPGSGVMAGTDCNDAAGSINPAAADPTDETLEDDDCDGLVNEDDIGEGDIVFTEFFVGASGSYDWVEIYNNSGVGLDLAGWSFSACTDLTVTESLPYACSAESDATLETFFLPSLVIPAYGYAVLCANDAVFTSVACDAEWAFSSISDIAANNGSFSLKVDALPIDGVDFWKATGGDDWPSAADASTQFSSDRLDTNAFLTNDDYAASGTTPADQWCLTASATYTVSTLGTLYGTPGGANEDCTP